MIGALLRDSLREALDRKSFVVLLVLSGLAILACASVSFRPLDERAALQSIADRFNLVTGAPGPGRPWQKAYRVKFTVGPVAGGEEEGKLRLRFRLEADPPADVHALVRHAVALLDRKVQRQDDPVPDAAAPADAAQQRRFLVSEFRDAGVSELAVTPVEGRTAWDVEVTGARRRALRGAEEMALFFGAVRWRPRIGGTFLSAAEVAAYVQAVLLTDLLAGTGWMIVALIVTAGIVPAMLQRGTVDVLLARPVSRPALLVAKYLGGCLFMLLASAALIGGSWLALSAATGYWNPYFPLTILVLAFLFAVLYSVSLLAGVLTRSAAVSAFTVLSAWMAFSLVGFLHQRGAGLPQGAAGVVEALYALLPRTKDLALLNLQLCAKGNLPDTAITVALFPAFGSGAAFAAVAVTAAAWVLSRRDC